MPAVRSRGRAVSPFPARVKTNKIINKQAKKKEEEEKKKEKTIPRQPKERRDCAICMDVMAVKVGNIYILVIVILQIIKTKELEKYYKDRKFSK